MPEFCYTEPLAEMCIVRDRYNHETKCRDYTIHLHVSAFLLLSYRVDRLPPKDAPSDNSPLSLKAYHVPFRHRFQPHIAQGPTKSLSKIFILIRIDFFAFVIFVIIEVSHFFFYLMICKT